MEFSSTSWNLWIELFEIFNFRWLMTLLQIKAVIFKDQNPWHSWLFFKSSLQFFKIVEYVMGSVLNFETQIKFKSLLVRHKTIFSYSSLKKGNKISHSSKNSTNLIPFITVIMYSSLKVIYHFLNAE